jgi:hypothetical protein
VERPLREPKPTDELLAKLQDYVKCDGLELKMGYDDKIEIFATQGGKRMFRFTPMSFRSGDSVTVTGLTTVSAISIE